VSFLDIAPVQGATTDTFGNTVVGTLTNSFSNDKDASRFQLTQNGVLQSITAYFGNTGFNAKAAIYTDNNGAPSTLITQSASQMVTVTGWQTFTVPAKSLTAGYYWLSVVSSSYSKGTMTPTSTNTHSWKTTAYTGEFTSTFGTPDGYEKTVTSIYATYTSTISTPTPTTTPTPTSTPATSSNNLVPIPEAWSSPTIGGISCGKSIGNDANIIFDTGVLHNGNPSIRLDPVGATSNYGREINGPALAVKPGDHIVFSCWIKTSASSYGDTNPYSGARIAIDFYANGYITAWQSLGQCVWDSSGKDIGAKTTYVNWNKDWTLIVMDFVIPATVPANGAYAGWGTQYSAGQKVVPTAIIPWMQVWSSTYGATDSGKAWFADATLYINP